MAFVPPVRLIRRNIIVKRLGACSAASMETAKALAEAKVLNPHGFQPITNKLVKDGIICKTANGRYYIP